MSPVYLLDTNVLSEPLRPTPNSSVLSHLRDHQTELATCAPVWHELVFGCRRLPRSRRRTLIQGYLDEVVFPTIPILPYDDVAARWHAEERARLAGAGLTPPFVDGQIAAIAAVHHLVLVTSNTADYANFRDLQVEDWRA